LSVVKYDRHRFHERRLSTFSIMDLMQQGMYLQDMSGRVWVNNDNGYFTPQVFPGEHDVVLATLAQVYSRARVVLDGKRRVVAKRRSRDDRLARIEYIPK
jgi:hypothetical protein